MDANQLELRAAAIRQFNRFYTGKIGLLSHRYLKTRFPVTQARILFELAHNDQITAKRIVQALDIDAGYLSRIINKFENEGLVEKRTSDSDSRQRLLKLTRKGQEAFSDLNQRSQQDIKDLIDGLSEEEQTDIIRSMKTIESILQTDSDLQSMFVLREQRAGDIGWMIYRHGTIYWEEYAWDESFEALVADILVQFTKNHDPKRERIWIAEKDGQRVGCIMVVDGGDNVAKLRLLLVEPMARGKGLGMRLLNETIRFAKHSGYRRARFWTNSCLTDARRLYVRAGFHIVKETPHKSFGHDLVGEDWEMELK